MFTGIIEETGKIEKIEKHKNFHTFFVKTNRILNRKKQGQSISVNGACMTIKRIKGKTLEFDAMPETMEKTNFPDLRKSSEVNLEASLKIGAELDGHMVQGHVDCTGTVKSLSEAKNRTVLRVKYPRQIKKFLATKGSITINGVSLTISGLDKHYLSVDLIPLTLGITNLSKLKKDDKVNMETDILARYLNSLLHAK
ncbi:MAG: riboflavin synthase [Candidatus Gracilibacteria bacterium]|jgi:riboflavin synthase